MRFTLQYTFIYLVQTFSKDFVVARCYPNAYVKDTSDLCSNPWRKYAKSSSDKTTKYVNLMYSVLRTCTCRYTETQCIQQANTIPKYSLKPILHSKREVLYNNKMKYLPDLQSIVASSLATMEPLFLIWLCLLYGRYGITATMDRAHDVLHAYAMISSSMIALFTSL